MDDLGLLDRFLEGLDAVADRLDPGQGRAAAGESPEQEPDIGETEMRFRGCERLLEPRSRLEDLLERFPASPAAPAAECKTPALS